MLRRSRADTNPAFFAFQRQLTAPKKSLGLLPAQRRREVLATYWPYYLRPPTIYSIAPCAPIDAASLTSSFSLEPPPVAATSRAFSQKRTAERNI